MTDAKDNFYENIARIAQALEDIEKVLNNVAWYKYSDAMVDD